MLCCNQIPLMEETPMKRKERKADRLTAGAWWSRNRWSCVILAAALVLFIVLRMAAVTFEQPQPQGDNYAEYETGVVTDILSDNTEADAVARRRLPGGAAAAGAGALRPVQGRDHAGV